jgi:hypothetical protein
MQRPCMHMPSHASMCILCMLESRLSCESPHVQHMDVSCATIQCCSTGSAPLPQAIGTWRHPAVHCIGRAAAGGWVSGAAGESCSISHVRVKCRAGVLTPLAATPVSRARCAALTGGEFCMQKTRPPCRPRCLTKHHRQHARHVVCLTTFMSDCTGILPPRNFKAVDELRQQVGSQSCHRLAEAKRYIQKTLS